MSTNMMAEAKTYCAEAISTVSKHALRGFDAAEAYGQLAVLHVVKGRYRAGAAACELAILLWQEVPEEIFKRMAADGVGRCRGVIADVARRRNMLWEPNVLQL